MEASGQAIPAFPGAEGAGAYAKGGRGGDVYHVTNTNASGAGSLHYGLTTGVPAAGRTIVFDVSGYSRISGTLRITNNKITIAGQTAPGDGFGLNNGTFLISSDDVVIRHLRVRDGNSADAINVDSNSINTVFDHIDAMLSNDENFSSFNSPPENVTFQWSINAWGMESHSAGGLWDQNHATAHHTLWSHNHTRNPKARPDGCLDWINNVTFDWDIGFIMGDSDSPANWRANVRGSYFVCPPGNIRSVALQSAKIDRNGNKNFSLYLDNCRMDDNGNGVLDFNANKTGYSLASGSYITSPTPFPNNGIPVTIDDPLLAYKKVLSNAGPLRLEADPAKPLRDELNTILINNVLTQKRHHVSSPAGTGASNGGFGFLNSAPAPLDTDQDGVPDFYETAVGWNASTADQNTALPNSGGFVSEPTFMPANTAVGAAALEKFTRLEEYLHFKAIPHGVVAKNIAGSPSFIDINLSKYTAGFTKTPVFTVSNVLNGTVTQSGTGGSLVRFVPTVNATGRAEFDFKVTDADGSNWTQQFGIIISATGAPRDLRWRGDGTANVWDSSAVNWRKTNEDPAGVPNTSFSVGDTALFDDNGSTTPTVSIPANVAPSSLTVNSTQNYTFTGAGGLTGAMPLTKSGAGTLTLSNTGNNFSGGLVLNEGTLSYTSAAGIGSGPIRLSGGMLSMPGSSTLGAAVTVLGPATINAPAGSNFLNGALTGSAPLTISGNSTLTIAGSLAGYTGTITVPTAANTLRLNQGASSGSGTVAFDLGTNSTLNNRVAGAVTVTLGSLVGGPNTRVQGSDQAGPATDTYVVGALGRDDIFAGTLRNGTNATPHALALTKVGTGTLTLTGTSTYTGVTTVSSGVLQLDGALGATALTVASGASLTGVGSTGGPVTINSGGRISPGNATTAAATMNVTGLTLNSTTLPFDLSSNPATGNDRIALNGGALVANGTLTFQFKFLNGLLGAGTYPLISGGSATSTLNPSVASNLPTGARQSYTLQTTNRGNINLLVGGAAGNLTWTGSPSNVWDYNNTSNWTDGPEGNNKFLALDAVTFTDSAANGNVAIATVVRPSTITVTNTALNYTLSGGSIAGTTALVKNGPGTLTLNISPVIVVSTTTAGATSVAADTSNLAPGMSVSGSGIPFGTTIASITSATNLVLSQAATTSATVSLSYYGNLYTGGTFINGGTVILGDDLANSLALGTGPVTFGNNTTLSMYDNTSGFNATAWGMIVPGGVTATLNADSRVDLFGALSGAGTLNLRIPWVRTYLYGDWSAFTGLINVTTDGDGGELPYGTNYGYPGFPFAAVHLPANLRMFFEGILSGGAGTTVTIGELAGASGSVFQGGKTVGRSLTYRIGGRNTDATFAGALSEVAAGNVTSYVKTGIGRWTLSGVCTYAGGTTVEQGTLRITGSLTSPQAINVEPAANLELQGASVTADAVNIALGATLTGTGTLDADLNNDGTVTASAGGTLTVKGAVVNNGTLRISNGTTLAATGSFVNNGVLDLLTAGPGLPANFENNGIVIDSTSLRTVSATKTGATVVVKVQGHSGHTYQLQRADSLRSQSWVNIGPAQVGTTRSDGSGTELSFSDVGGAIGDQRFYKVQVGP
ncbi:MAG TPA: autotransporter-associated beta strand repeat-containing protein [Chthoniobacteraceae bacterium]